MLLAEAIKVFDTTDELGPICCTVHVSQDTSSGIAIWKCLICNRSIENSHRDQWLVREWGTRGIKLNKDSLPPPTLYIYDQITSELASARAKFQNWTDPHEGWAKLYEEVDELWDLVKAYPKTATLKDMRAEAIQVAATAIRFITDICDKRSK